MSDSETVAGTGRQIVEIGWVLVGRMEDADLQAALRTREQILSRLNRVFPEFEWRLPLTMHEEFFLELQERVIRLLDVAGTDRDLRHWDFAVLITETPLVGQEKATPWAALSTALGAAVISTARLDPGVSRTASDDAERTRTMAQRIETLALHCLGHLTGLEHEGSLTNCMFDFQTIEELDQSQRFEAQQLEQMRSSLREIADQRLEEQALYQRVSSASFYFRSAWVNRRELLRAILKAEPWLFPIRLSRLAFAAVSALVILLMTAESWELGMSLSGVAASSLSAICLLGTTGYIVLQQRLLVRRLPHGVQEQRVIALVSIPVIVLLGIFTTFLILFAATLTVGMTLFHRSVVENWAASVQQIGLPQYLSLAAHVASVALVIAALGASLEDQRYFRHVTLVDEEI
ncbi:MAG: hypothetical protein KDA79_09885 [Planctomycetaceae bacterium]|nr:hypothetical protein [Planctomycetaceae bacterium]